MTRVKSKLFYATVPVFLIGAAYFCWQSLESVPAEDKADLVERYGVIQTSSTSGEFRLSYYDMEQGRVLDSWESHPWFFATPEDINDQESTQEQYEYVQSNQESILKVVGKKDADDCGYYGNGVCVESIIVERIEAVGRLSK